MAKKLWGGRFKKKTDKKFFDFQKSIDYDYKLAEYDIYHSMIHAKTLKRAKILDEKEAKVLSDALEELLQDIKSNKFKPDIDSEDIHTDIQNKLEAKNKVKKSALKLHALRSRNDQIVFDERFYCAEKALGIQKALLNLIKNLLYVADRYKKQKFIGYTHTQRAQVILFIDYLFAFANMFNRDAYRIMRFYDKLCIYIGAGALTGSSLSRKDYNYAIKEFSQFKNWHKIKPTENALDNVSDRDFIVELLSILSILQMHLSRLAEDSILYSTIEFNFISLPEEFCTGSSLMPHKKNPDFLELVRGYTGIVYGNLISVLTMMKGLPLTYNKDMQLDKPPLFSSIEIIEKELKIMTSFIRGIKLNKEVIDSALNDIKLYATELAEWLVTEKKVPFKKAHDTVGKFILLFEKKNEDINKIDEKELERLHPDLSKEIIKKIMNPDYAIKTKKSFFDRIPKNSLRK